MFQLWIFKLFADSHTLPGPYELGKIGVEGMVRKSGKLDAPGIAVASARQGYAENFRSLDSINTHHLIEIANTEQQDCVRVFLLHLPVLRHQRSFSDFCNFGFGRRCRLGCRHYRVWRGWLYPFGIIQFQI